MSQRVGYFDASTATQSSEAPAFEHAAQALFDFRSATSISGIRTGQERREHENRRFVSGEWSEFDRLIP